VGWGSCRIQSDLVELSTSYIPATPPRPYPLAELTSAIAFTQQAELTSS
jgi:hypothetical protein